MPISSPFPRIEIPQTDLLTYLFPPGTTPSDEPIWIDASDPKETLSPRQLYQWVKRLAIGLDRLGVRHGESVMIFTPNQLFVPVAYLGIVGSRRVFSGANPAYTLPEMVHQITNTGAKVLLAHPSLLETAVGAASAAGLPRERIFQLSEQPVEPVDDILDWRNMIASPAEADACSFTPMTAKESQETVATVNYSSGTTGLPKGVCVSHYNIIANTEQTIFIRYHGKGFEPQNRPPERWLGFLPLYHAYGQLYTIVMCVKLMVPVYIMKQFVFETFLKSIQDYRITQLQAAPPILVMLSKRPETSKYDLSSVTDILCGAAPLSRELQNDVAKRFHVQINQGWGMTEVTCGALHVPGGVNDNTGSVGQLDPNTECMMMDDDGNEVQEGQPGEMFIRGPQVMLRYWKNEAATKESLDADGWLKTGDIAIMKQGWFWIVDRKKELIKVNALQVAPAELEAVLLENDDIADAAVVGVTLHGEEWPRAYVSLKDHAKGQVMEQAIQKWMAARVAKHKRLVGGVQFVEEVPKLASGKIMRKVLKEWAKRDASGLEAQVKARL